MGNQEQVGAGCPGTAAEAWLRILGTRQAGQGRSRRELKSGQVSGVGLWAPRPCSRGLACGLQEACSAQALFAPRRDY